jgi:hypothetical protein
VRFDFRQNTREKMGFNDSSRPSTMNQLANLPIMSRRLQSWREDQ